MDIQAIRQLLEQRAEYECADLQDDAEDDDHDNPDCIVIYCCV